MEHYLQLPCARGHNIHINQARGQRFQQKCQQIKSMKYVRYVCIVLHLIINNFGFLFMFIVSLVVQHKQRDRYLHSIKIVQELLTK